VELGIGTPKTVFRISRFQNGNATYGEFKFSSPSRVYPRMNLNGGRYPPINIAPSTEFYWTFFSDFENLITLKVT
jgi:hypothetical protein